MILENSYLKPLFSLLLFKTKSCLTLSQMILKNHYIKAYYRSLSFHQHQFNSYSDSSSNLNKQLYYKFFTLVQLSPLKKEHKSFMLLLLNLLFDKFTSQIPRDKNIQC